MNCKHVDIVAIAVLLLGMALYSASRRRAIPIVAPHPQVIAEPSYCPLALDPKATHVTFAFD